MRLGAFVELVTAVASMVAFINYIVGGAGVTMLAGVLLGDDQRGLALGLGAVAAVAAFLTFQRWRYSTW